MTPEVERAAEVMYVHCDIKSRDETWDDFHERAAAALSAAGLLRTDADRLNAELAEAMVAYGARCGGTTFVMNESWAERTRVWAALRAILDARKPSPRFAVGNGGAGMLYTVFEVGHPTDGIVGYFPSKADAAAYAAIKNAEGAK